MSAPPLLPPILHHVLPTTSPAQFRTVPVKLLAPISSLLPPVYKQSRPAIIDLVQSVPTDLGRFISRDVKLLNKLGWHGLVAHCRPTSNFALLKNVQHLAHCLMQFYNHRGAPVKSATPPWTCQKIVHALHQGPHKSCHNHISFLQEEFIDMISKGQWLVLLLLSVKNLPGICTPPLALYLLNATGDPGGFAITVGGAVMPTLYL